MPSRTLNQDLYLSAFDSFERTVADTDPAWLHQLRKAAFTRFKELGFPGRRNEDWKYTRLDGLLDIPFRLANEKECIVEQSVVDPYRIADAVELVFVNGVFTPALSKLDETIDGLTAINLADAVVTHADRVEMYLGKLADYDSLALTALNTAFVQDGGFIDVAPNVAVQRPIHLLHVSTASSEPTMAFPRHLILTGRNSQVTVTESHVAVDCEVAFNNSVVELHAEENAHVNHVKIVREGSDAYHIANLQIHQKRDSNVASHYVALTGKLIRNESRTVFQGENGECTMNGLYLGGDAQHIDSHTVIDHAVPHCNSHELYKGLLDDRSHGVFNGKIFVREDAQKTDAKQSNQCILLSDTATIDTKPQLEIFADDVKCTHGATVGQLDERALFYLRSRGIGVEQARSLLMYAFANDILQRITVAPIRAQLEDLLLTRQQLPHYQETV